MAKPPLAIMRCTGASVRRFLFASFSVSPRSFLPSFMFALRADPRAPGGRGPLWDGRPPGPHGL